MDKKNGMSKKNSNWGLQKKPPEKKYIPHNYANSPWDIIDLPCNHYISFNKADNQAGRNEYSFIECLICKTRYEAFSLLEMFHKENPNPLMIKYYRPVPTQETQPEGEKDLQNAKDLDSNKNGVEEHIDERQELRNKRMQRFDQSNGKGQETYSVPGSDQIPPIPAKRTIIKGQKIEKNDTSLGKPKDNNGILSIAAKEFVPSDDVVCICMTCEKPVPQSLKHFHSQKSHCELRSLKDGLEKIKSKNDSKRQCLKSKSKEGVKEIERFENKLSNSKLILTEIGNFLSHDQMVSQLKHEGHSIISDLQNSVTNVASNFAELNSQTKYLNSVEEREAKWCNQAEKQVPLWLLSPWIKSSFAMLLFNYKSQGSDVFVQFESDKFALVELEGNCVLLHSIQVIQRSHIDPNDKIIDMNVIRSIFDDNESHVFLKITHGNDEVPGRVVASLNMASYWGRQFMNMCSGTHGRSFEGCLFYRNCYKNQPGHHIWSGDDSKQDGTGGDPLDNGTELSQELDYFPSPITPGLLASRFGHKDTSTIFRVYVQGAETDEKFAFGLVEEGLSILTYIAKNHEKQQSPRISNVGRIFMLQ